MKRIFKKGNFLFVVDVETGRLSDSPLNKASITKTTEDGTNYAVKGLNIELFDIEFEDILDANGDPYANLDAFETFRTDFTGVLMLLPLRVSRR